MHKLRLCFLWAFVVTFLFGGAALYAQTNGVKWTWAKAPTKGDPSSVLITHDIKVDPAGNQYVTGYFRGSIDFGDGTLIPSASANGVPTRDIFVAKYDLAGALKWVRTFGSVGEDEGTGIAINPTTLDVVISAFIGGSVSISTGLINGTPITRTPIGNQEAAALKLDDLDGDVYWFSTIGSSFNDAANDVVIDPISGDAFIAGFVEILANATVTCVPGPSGTGTLLQPYNNPLIYDPAQYNVRNQEIMFARLNDATGGIIFYNTSGRPGVDDYATSLHYYNDQVPAAVYIAGAVNRGGLAQQTATFFSYDGTLPFFIDPDPTSAGLTGLLYGGSDAFFASFNATNGQFNQVDGYIFGGSKNDVATSIGLDRLENVFVTGTFQDVAQFGRGGLAFLSTNTGAFNTSDDNVFFASYGNQNEQAPEVGWKTFNWVSTAGLFNGVNDFGADLVVNQQPDFGAGTVQFVGGFRSSPFVVNPPIGRGNIPVADPGVAGTADGKLNNTGGTNAVDGFVAKFNPNGRLYWLRDIECDGDDSFAAIAQNSKDQTFIAINYGNAPVALDYFEYPNIPANKSVFAEISDRIAPSWQGANKPANGAFSNDIFVDNDGFIYVTGRYQNTVNFAMNGLAPGATVNGVPAASGSVTSNGNADYFVAKYTNDQKLVWLRTAGGTTNDEGYSLVVDAARNVYVAGYFQGNNVVFSAQNAAIGSSSSSPNATDAFIAKYNQNGDLTGFVKVNGDGNDAARDIAIDKTGSFLYVTGGYASVGNPRFESSPTVFLPGIAGTGGVEQMFTAKISALTGFAPNTLSFIWARNTAECIDPAPGPCATFYQGGRGNGITVSTNNNVYVAYTLVINGFQQAAVTKYDEDGTAIWQAINGPAITGVLNAPTVPNNNAQAIGISVFNSVDAGTGVLKEEVFVAGNFIDDDGTVSTSYFESGRANHIDRVVTAEAAVAIPGGGSGDKDIFLASYDVNGTLNWVAEMGNKDNDDDVYRVLCNEIGNPYVLGYHRGDGRFYDRYRLDPITQVNNTPNKDLFIAEYDRTGLLNWVKNVICSGNDEAKGIALDKNYQIFLTGNYDGSDLTAGDYNLAGPPNNSGFFILRTADVIQTGTEIFANTGVQNYRVCAGTSDVVRFIPQGNFVVEPGNVFTVELSDPNGNFNTAQKRVIGSVPGTSANIQIPVTIPNDQVFGTQYRIRVTTSAPAFTALDNGTNITIDPKPFARIQGDTTFCSGSSVVLTAVNANLNAPLAVPGGVLDYNYQWFRNGVAVGANTNQIVVDDASTGSYTVSISRRTPNAANSLACEDLSPARTIVALPLPQPVVTVNKTVNGGNGTAASPFQLYVCSGDTVSFEVNEFNSYLWSNNQTTRNITVANAIPNFDYFVDVTDANGCVNRSAYYRINIVNIPKQITAGGVTTICEGQSVQLTAPAVTNIPGVPVTYEWKRNGEVLGATGAVYTVQAVDTFNANNTSGFSVVVKQGDCAVESDPISVTVVNNDIVVSFNGVPVTSAAPQTFCANETFTLSAPEGYFSYQWWRNGTPIPGAIQREYTSNEQGSYAIQYQTLPNICGLLNTLDAQVQVVALAIPQASIFAGANAVSGVTYFCEAETLNLSAVPAGANYSYRWLYNGQEVSTDATIQVTPATAGEYVLFIRDNVSGCESNVSDTVVATAIPTPAPAIHLFLNGVEVQPSATGATGTQQDPFIVRICPGQQVELRAAEGFASYVWSTGATTSSISRGDAGIYAVIAETVMGGVSCKGVSAYYSIELPSPAIAEILATSSTGANLTTSEISICAGDSVKLAAFVPSGDSYVFNWQRKSGDQFVSISTDQTIWVRNSAVYRLVVRRSNELCEVVSREVELAVLAVAGQQFRPVKIGQDSICAGDGSLTLDAGAGYTLYQWFRRQVFTNSTSEYVPVANGNTRFVKPLEAGIWDYKVIVSSLFCGQNIESQATRVTVNVLPAAPTLTVVSDVLPPLVPTQATIVINDSIPGYTYIYTLGDIEVVSSSPRYTTSKGGNWTVTVINENGCQNTGVVFVNTTDIVNSVAEALIGNLDVYPNPTQSDVNIRFVTTQAVDARIEVYTVTGQQIVDRVVKTIGSEHTEVIGLSGLTSGVYTVKVTAGKQTLTTKVIRN